MMAAPALVMAVLVLFLHQHTASAGKCMHARTRGEGSGSAPARPCAATSAILGITWLLWARPSSCTIRQFPCALLGSHVLPGPCALPGPYFAAINTHCCCHHHCAAAAIIVLMHDQSCSHLRPCTGHAMLSGSGDAPHGPVTPLYTPAHEGYACLLH